MGQSESKSQEKISFYEQLQSRNKFLAFIVYFILFLIFGLIFLWSLVWLLEGITQFNLQNYQNHILFSASQQPITKEIWKAILENLSAPAITTLIVVMILTKIIGHLGNTCWAAIKYIAKWMCQ